MPMMDVALPNGVFDEVSERALLARLTNVLIRWEGADPENSRVRSLAWVFVHRNTAVYVAGTLADAPRYRVRVSAPQGQLDDESRAGMVAAVTGAILDAQAGRFLRDANRVWVFPVEIPDGSWGAGGTIWPLRDIAGFTLDDRERGRAYASRRLAVHEPARARA